MFERDEHYAHQKSNVEQMFPDGYVSEHTQDNLNISSMNMMLKDNSDIKAERIKLFWMYAKILIWICEYNPTAITHHL